ncbi:MAG TPA: pitrilysin family protein [Pyrinomonadaceae bacterium]
MLPPIKFTDTRLPNGLRLILHEDHSTPIVAVNIWYHVGSKNEVPGRTGFAHLFEHMMFQGSKHYDNDFFVPLQEAGGTLNGSTNSDRTNYWEVVPSNFLELALWLESDRMGYLLDALTEEKLTNQRDVVKNEKRQNYDNRPYGLVSEQIATAMYPPGHPYRWLTIGSLEDLNAASLADVSNFFRRFYTPNNASLVIAGDFDPTEAGRLVEKYFGPIKPGPTVEPVIAPAARLERELRITMEDRVSLPRVYISWHGVPAWAGDDAELDTLSTVLAGGKGSRLYKALVYEQQIAQDVTAFNNSRELAGQFQIVATVKPGKAVEELERAIDEQLEMLKREAPPTVEEMERAYNARESSFVYSLQTVGGFGGRSDQLNQYAVFLNDPGYFQQDLARYASVTAEDVARVANAYLTDRRLVLTVIPGARAKEIAAAPPAPTGPAVAVEPTSEPTETTTLTGAPGTDPQAATTGAVVNAAVRQAQSVDPAAGAHEQSRAEAAATTPAGAAPPATIAHAGPHEKQDEQRETGGLYLQPAAKPDPRFALPLVQRRTLSNGLGLVIVEHHELPVVTLNVVLGTGAAADPPERAGLASITAALLDEGTRGRSALDISNELAAIGARLGTGADWDLSGVSLLSVARHLESALSIFKDVLARPSFPERELELQRNTRLTAIMQRRDNPQDIAGVVFASLLYGREHPYGHPIIGDEPSVRAVTLDDIKSFYRTYYRPNNATLIVVGDVSPEALVPQLERAFAGWERSDVPQTTVNAPSESRGSGGARLYLVDKPNAAQSVIVIGQVGPSRSTPDYFPLLVMNTMLGGQFTSRLNLNLREDKGYTYGARTFFDYRRGVGPFAATTSVQTAVTKESIEEIRKELRGIRGEIPVTESELEFSKQAIIRGFPRSFETPEHIANRLADVVVYGLPDDYFNHYIESVRSVTREEVMEVARRYLDPSRMVILVVGDRAVVEPDLRALDGVGPTLTILDMEGTRAEG